MTSSRAFTLIELLVVIAIIAVLTSMVFASGVILRDRSGVRVAAAAQGVERMLLDARNLAITKGRPHAVVFHIENAGAGTVLRNRDINDVRDFPGRHWCAIIGPYPPLLRSGLLYEDLPRMGPGFLTSQVYEFGTAQRLADTVARYQIGDRYYLPRGTRFLALGDAEDNVENPSNSAIPTATTINSISNWNVGTATRNGIATLSDTYPRPWFGFLNESAGSWRLYPWGGYDVAIAGSGFDYECTTRYRSGGTLVRTPIINSTNSETCRCAAVTNRVAQTPAQNVLDEDMRPCCDAAAVGSPRPLMNGYWMDFMVVFLPNGQSRGVAFFNRQYLFSFATNENALKDRVKGDSPTNARFHGRDDAIIVFERSVLGGTTITIAKDALAQEDNGIFTSPQQALASLLPMRRIIVNDFTGGIRVAKPFASIDKWLEEQERDVPSDQRIWTSGWEFCDAADPHPQKIRVSGALTAELLQQHNPYPWIKPSP